MFLPQRSIASCNACRRRCSVQDRLAPRPCRATLHQLSLELIHLHPSNTTSPPATISVASTCSPSAPCHAAGCRRAPQPARICPPIRKLAPVHASLPEQFPREARSLWPPASVLPGYIPAHHAVHNAHTQMALGILFVSQHNTQYVHSHESRRSQATAGQPPSLSRSTSASPAHAAALSAAP